MDEQKPMDTAEKPQNSPEQKPSGTSVGPAIGIIIIIIILVLGALYFWNTQLSNITTGDKQTQELLETNDSDDIAALEADLEATDLDNLDAELNDIEGEFEAGGETSAQ